MDFSDWEPCMDSNKQLEYLLDDHQVHGVSINGIPPLETCYQITGFSFYQEWAFHNNAPMMEQITKDESYDMPIVPRFTTKFSPSSSSLTMKEDRFSGYRGDNKIVIKTVRKNLTKNTKKTNMIKGQWTLDEDGQLIRLVEKHGIRKWAYIAQMLPGRIGKQCRERWHNHLRPNIKKDSWTEEEDKVLIEAHKEIGNKWAEIVKQIPGRTENSLKNHWNTTKRRLFSCRRTRSKNSKGATNNSILEDYIKSLGFIVNTKNVPSPSTAPTLLPAMAPEKMKKLQNMGVEDVLLPSCDSLGDMYGFLFDGNDYSLLPEKCGTSTGFIRNNAIDKIDEVLMEMAWDDDDMFIDADNGVPLVSSMPSDNRAVVKKEMDLLEMISESVGHSEE